MDLLGFPALVCAISDNFNDVVLEEDDVLVELLIGLCVLLGFGVIEVVSPTTGTNLTLALITMDLHQRRQQQFVLSVVLGSAHQRVIYPDLNI